MWCSQCQADVATEISADGKRLLCTICGEEVRKVFAPSEHPETKSARELLERWSKNELQISMQTLDVEEPQEEIEESVASAPVSEAGVYQRPAYEPPAAEPLNVTESPLPEDTGADLLPSPREELPVAETANDDKAPTDKASRPVRKIHRGGRPPLRREPAPRSEEEPDPVVRNWRVDAAHAESRERTAPATPPRRSYEYETTAPRAAAVRPSGPVDFRDDRAHESTPAPHFDLEPFTSPSRRPGRHESIFGQLLAYLGVALLTIGTVLVVWGYFGGADVARYQSTGWLISTAGQMLLFLGVVTLVSGGMQQTTHEVSQRVELLGGRMQRIEQSTQELLRGPYFARENAGRRSIANSEDAESA
jgi:hypothetical protein